MTTVKTTSFKTTFPIWIFSLNLCNSSCLARYFVMLNWRAEYLPWMSSIWTQKSLKLNKLFFISHYSSILNLLGMQIGRNLRKQECIPVGCVPSALRPPGQRPLLDRDPLDRDPPTETPLDRDTPQTKTPPDRDLGQRPPPYPVDRQTLKT